MGEQSPDPFAHAVHPTEWAIILSDWKRNNADVTVHLRSGATLGPGKITRLPGKALDSAELHARRTYAQPETKWTFDLNDVAAVTAEATR